MNFARASIEKIYGGRFAEDNNVALLYKDREAFNSIFRSIAEAKDFICLQFYIFRNDETGTEMAELLRQRAKAGVRIYILYDHFGSLGTPRSFWKYLEDAGISVKASRPLKWLSLFHYIHRDHRKLIIIDGIRAFTGGLNIANEYRGLHIRLRSQGWRDTGVMLEGPIAMELFKTFDKAWTIWGGEPLRPMAQSGPGIAKNDGLPIMPIFASSAKTRRRMRKLLYYSINHSSESILLTTAYFTPSSRMLDAIEEAVSRGVEVRLLLPGKSDVPAAYYAGRAFFSRLLRHGVKIYQYQGDVLHAKTYVFDGCWSIVGSANLDFQSMRWNDEGNVGILDRDFGERMTAVFEDDIRRSTEITGGVWGNRSLSLRLKERFFVLFRRRL